jgi:hypothetical protein
MSNQYKDNNFSIEKLSTSHASYQDNIGKTVRPKRPNIDHLIKRLIVERRREKRNTLALGFVILLVVVLTVFFKS